MSHSIFRRALSPAVLLIMLSGATPVFCEEPPQARDVTIRPETKARLTLQSRINSRISETDDVVTATLAEPVYVDGQQVLARGVEFIGRIIKVTSAKRGQRSSSLSIEFQHIVTSNGDDSDRGAGHRGRRLGQ